MSLLSRRHLITRAGGLLTGAAIGAPTYAVAIEGGLRLAHTHYDISPPRWPAGLSLRIAVIADIHACEPWMSAARIRAITDMTNALAPDVTMVLGDFNAGHDMVTRAVEPQEWGAELARLHAPLGVFAILGNHDWWHGALPDMPSDDAHDIGRALKAAGIRLLDNDAARVRKDGRPIWILGLADQMARRHSRTQWDGFDDLDGTLARVTNDAPIIMLAHEPFIFHRMPARVALTLCGHTHGGQVNLPFVASHYLRERFGSYIYGHIIENGRHMVISAGLGASNAPIRFMRPPEIVTIDLGAPALGA